MNFLNQVADLDKTSSTALSNSDLSFSLPAGRRVSGHIWCSLNISLVAPGVKMRLNVSSAPTLYRVNAQYVRTLTNVVDPWSLNVQTDMTDAMTGSAGLNQFHCQFHIVANAAATVTLQFAQLVSNAAVITLHQGSYMIYYFG